MYHLKTAGGPCAKAPVFGIMFKSFANDLLVEGKETGEQFCRGLMCSNYHIGRERPQNKKEMNKYGQELEQALTLFVKCFSMMMQNKD